MVLKTLNHRYQDWFFFRDGEGGREGGREGRLVFSCLASGVKLLLFDTANFKRLVMQFKSLDMLLQKNIYCPGLSKVAGCRRKSPPTWLVSAS